MNMIAVGNIVFICNPWQDSKTFLQALGKTVGGGLHGSAVHRITDMLGFFPLSAFVVKTLHDFKGKFLCFPVCVRLAHHAHGHFT